MAILKGKLMNGQNSTMVFPDSELEKTVVSFYQKHGRENISSLYCPETMSRFSATQYGDEWEIECF